MKPSLTIPKVLVDQVKKTDPTAYLNTQGFEVKTEGKHLSAKMNGDEVYRLTQKNEGYWLFTTKDGSKGGDNIALVTEIEGLKFKDAVYRLSNESLQSPSKQTSFQSQSQHRNNSNSPVLPFQSPGDAFQGRKYLSEERKISINTINEAEKQGLLKYTSDGVLFAGYDQDGKIKNLTKRMIKDPSPEILWIVEKGADKPPILNEISKISSVNSKNYSGQTENLNIPDLQNTKLLITSKAKDSERKPEIAHIFIINENTKHRLLEQLKTSSDKSTEIISDKDRIHKKINSEEFQSSIKNASMTIISPSTKRDLSGSDKYYPQILEGSPKSVWLVEGSIDALALRDMAIRSKKNPPTVIISSGSRVTSFLDNNLVQERLKVADNIVIAKEREKDLNIQKITDQDHQKQADKITKITGKKVIFFTPPESTKDLADFNKKQIESLTIDNTPQKTKNIELSK